MILHPFHTLQTLVWKEVARLNQGEFPAYTQSVSMKWRFFAIIKQKHFVMANHEILPLLQTDKSAWKTAVKQFLQYVKKVWTTVLSKLTAPDQCGNEPKSSKT